MVHLGSTWAKRVTCPVVRLWGGAARHSVDVVKRRREARYELRPRTFPGVALGRSGQLPAAGVGYNTEGSMLAFCGSRPDYPAHEAMVRLSVLLGANESFSCSRWSLPGREVLR